jgi:hypothetical protein
MRRSRGQLADRCATAPASAASIAGIPRAIRAPRSPLQVWCKLNRVVPSTRGGTPGLLRVVGEMAATAPGRPLRCMSCCWFFEAVQTQQNRRLRLTGAAILVFRASISLQAAPAAWPRPFGERQWPAMHERTSRAGGALVSPRVRPACRRADSVARNRLRHASLHST